MAARYDLVIIGTGVAASTAAYRCRDAGWRVAIIDHLPFGGVCALRGCDPKKILVGVADALDLAQRLRGKGVRASDLGIDWRELIAFERSFTEPVPLEREEQFAKNGIEALRGHARFHDEQTVDVDGEKLEARFILIAAGAKPMKLGVEGEQHLATSTDFLRLDSLPKSIALVGGGFIAAEFSHIAARAGAKVTILEQGDRMLTQFDPDLVAWLTEKTRALGVDIRLRTKVEAIEKTGSGFRVAVASNGASSSLETELVVHAAGRAPDLDSLDLEAGGVARRNGRLQLDEFLRSVSNRRVYAAGDAAAKGPPLTPIAAYDAKIVATNMLQGDCERPDYSIVPSAAFTIPPLARVGLLEDEARERNLRFRTTCAKTSGWYTARRVGEDCAGFKTLVEEGSDRILGAHVLGPNAEDVIDIFALAMRAGVTAQQLKSQVFAYPTAVSDVGHML